MSSADVRSKGKTAWRYYVNDGDANSGANHPAKEDILPFVDATADAIKTLEDGQATGGAVFATKAQADAALNYPANTRGEVYADPGGNAVNGVYQKQGAPGAGSWTRISALATTVLDSRLTTAEGEIDALQTATAPLPDLITTVAGLAGEPAKSRRRFRALPFKPDWTDPVQAPVSWSPSLSAFLNRFAVAAVGSELAITRSAATDGIIGSTLYQFDTEPVGLQLDVGARKQAGAAVASVEGPCIALPDTDSGEYGAGSRFILWRASGILLVVDRTGAGAADPVLSWDHPIGGAAPPNSLAWVPTDSLVMRLTVLGGGRATVSLFKNGEWVATYFAANGTFTRVGAAWRTSYTASADYRLTTSTSLSRRDVTAPTSVFVSEDATVADAPTDSGRVSAPYRRLANASMRFEEHGDRLKIILRDDGVNPVRGSMSLWSHRYREIHLVADKGFRPRIYGSRRPVWTQPDAASAPNVWMTATRYRGVVGATTAIGAIFDLTTPPPAGKAVTRITSAGNNQSLATMNGGAAGRYSIQTTGTYTANILMHAPGGVDPNTLALEVPEWFAALEVIPTAAFAAASRYGCRVIAEGVTFGFGADAAARISRADSLFNDVTFIGAAATNCLHVENGNGEANSCRWIGAQNDGWNLNTTTPAGYPAPAYRDDGIAFEWRFRGGESWGHIVGDGGSNHSRVFADVVGGWYHHAAKHGLSLAESARVIGVVAEANPNGAIFLGRGAGVSPLALDSYIEGCLLRGATDPTAGALTFDVASGQKGVLRAFRNTMEGSARAIVVSNGAGNAPTDCRLIYGDNKAQNNTNNGIAVSNSPTLEPVNGALIA